MSARLGHSVRVVAAEQYEISVEPPPKWIVPGLVAMAFTVGLLANSTEVWTYGRRRAVIRDRSSGAIVGRFTEPRIVNHSTRFGLMLTEVGTMSPSEFERVWLQSDDNAFLTPN